jgi:predicted ester cyclase
MAGGTIRGRRQNEDVWHALFNGFPDVVFSAEGLVIDGNRSVWITETRGTDTGGFLGVPPTGRPFRLPVVWVCTLDGGRIVHERRIYDFTGIPTIDGALHPDVHRPDPGFPGNAP